MREAEAAVLADFLASGRKLTIADFSNNPFGDVGVGHLLEAAHGKAGLGPKHIHFLYFLKLLV